MDRDRFDRLARALSAGRSRRRVAHLLGALAMAPLVDLGDAGAKKKKGKGKKKKKKTNQSPPAVRCTPNCAGKACGDDGCGGSCGTCGNVPCRDVCQGGACISANDTPCNGSGRCLNGTCNPDPMCGAGGLDLCTMANPGFCCSNVCTDDICAPGNPGDECRVRTDCNGAGCIGFRCQ